MLRGYKYHNALLYHWYSSYKPTYLTRKKGPLPLEHHRPGLTGDWTVPDRSPSLGSPQPGAQELRSHQLIEFRIVYGYA
jgi:hypothetical protein